MAYRVWLRRGAYLVQFACFAHVFNEYVGEITMCMGASMLPTFNMMGDFVLIERWSTYTRRLKVGDVVVSISPTDPKRSVCKRLIGMSGDIVCVDPTKSPRKYIEVPRGYVWLQGDNFNNSTDSRVYGPVPWAMLRGRVIAKLWPDMEWIRNNVEVIRTSKRTHGPP